MTRGKQPLDDNMAIDYAGDNMEGQPIEKVLEIPMINLEDETYVK